MKSARETFQRTVLLRSGSLRGSTQVDARFDLVDARFDRVEVRLDGLDIRVHALEARALDTKPIWERALTEILEVKKVLKTSTERSMF